MQEYLCKLGKRKGRTWNTKDEIEFITDYSIINQVSDKKYIKKKGRNLGSLILAHFEMDEVMTLKKKTCMAIGKDEGDR